jgi:hypothetical protein
MNVGYASNKIDLNAECPLCGADVYVSKYQNDYKCMNQECLLNEYTASKLIGKINSLLYKIGGDI